MCDLGMPCGDPYCPFVSTYVEPDEGRVKKDQADLEENLMALAYLDFVGLNTAKKKVTKIRKATKRLRATQKRLGVAPIRIWCPYAEESGFGCPNIGVEESCTDGKNPCLRVEEAEDESRDRPFDRQDPWEFKREVSPTHMNF